MELDCATLHTLRRDDSAKALLPPKVEACRRHSIECTARVSNPGVKGAAFCGSQSSFQPSPEGRTAFHPPAIHVDTSKAVHSIDMMHVEEELRSVRSAIAALDDKVCKATSFRVHCILILQEANGASTRLEQAYHNKVVSEPSFFLETADKIKAAVERGGVVVTSYGYWDDAEVAAELVQPSVVLSAFNKVISQLKAFMRRRTAEAWSGGKAADAFAVYAHDAVVPECRMSAPVMMPLGPYAAYASLDCCLKGFGASDNYDECMNMMAMDFTPLDMSPASPRCMRMAGSVHSFFKDDSAKASPALSAQLSESSEGDELETLEYMGAYGAFELSTDSQPIELQSTLGYTWMAADEELAAMAGPLPLSPIEAVSAPRAAKVSHLFTMLDLSLTAVSLMAAVERRDGEGCWEVIAGLQERIAKAAV